MELLFDTSSMEAMVQATIQAEAVHENAKLSNDWQSTLEDLLIRPSVPQDDLVGFDRPKEGPSRISSLNKIDYTGKAWDEDLYQKIHKPIKIVPPPTAIKIDSSHLAERIASLQGNALIG